MIILIVVALLEFAYIIYQDIGFKKERERYLLKLMSENVVEYQRATEPQPKETKQKKEVYKDLDDVSSDTLLTAEDNL